MKTPVRGVLILVMVLAMVGAYLGGFVSAQTSSAPAGAHAPALTNVQLAALAAANAVLLEGDGTVPTYLPIMLAD